MFNIQLYNAISEKGLSRFSKEQYQLGTDLAQPDAIMLRSQKLHDMTVPESLKAIGRAGAGVNNIPVASMTEKGIPVFNAPGANANAVKELVLAGMLIAARNLCAGWDYAKDLSGDDDSLNKAVEKGKKSFAGFELPGRTLGVVGLGAIGVKVANAAVSLGMRVVGFDPTITVKRAWELSASVEQANSVDDLVSQSDFVTVHVPLMDQTRNLINADRIAKMPQDVILLNFSRQGIIDDQAVCDGINDGKIYGYVCDFPTNLLKNHPKVITMPHLGASTQEAEENCAIMIADQLKDFLENGNITNSVNFPEVKMPRTEGYRIALANQNVPNMVGQISTTLANAEQNIIDMLNKSRGDIAYTLFDVNNPVTEALLNELQSIEGVLNVRAV